MERNGIFYPDIWGRVLLTETPILKEIVESDFDERVLRKMKDGNRAL